jgi:hypothetical protein
MNSLAKPPIDYPKLAVVPEAERSHVLQLITELLGDEGLNAYFLISKAHNFLVHRVCLEHSYLATFYDQAGHIIVLFAGQFCGPVEDCKIKFAKAITHAALCSEQDSLDVFCVVRSDETINGVMAEFGFSVICKQDHVSELPRSISHIPLRGRLSIFKNSLERVERLVPLGDIWPSYRQN